MTSTSNPRPSRIAWVALALGALAVPSSAQETPTRTADAREQVVPPKNSPEALATAARNILELIETHRFRMRRIDASLAYYRSIGDVAHVRQFQLLREREQNEYQQSLEIYRRMLGDQDFLRIVTLLRDKLTESQVDPASSEEGDPHAGARRADAAADDASAAERAARVRREMEAQEAAQRERAAQQAAVERQQAIARARASQRMQLAQRLQQARNDQLEARAAAARRFQPPPVSGPGARPAGASAGSTGNSQGARPASAGRPERP
jgi:hypothetical protein